MFFGYVKDFLIMYLVLYLFYGYGDDELVWLEVGCVNFIVDNLVV